MQVWQDELTITPEYLESHLVYVFEEDGRVVAYYSLVELLYDQEFSCVTLQQGVWLDHMFVLPCKMGQGIGRELFEHCLAVLKHNGSESLLVLADPNAAGFYEKMGCTYVEDYPSTIEGRTTPHLEYRLTAVEPA